MRIPASPAWSTSLLILLAAGQAGAQGPREFLVRCWTRENGLQGTTVSALAQTSEGYLWVGTFGGLSRFDGNRFTTVKLPKGKEETNPLVAALFADRQGGLWISTGDGQLLHYFQGEFASFTPPSHGTAERPQRRILQNPSDSIWMLNYEGGLNLLSGGLFKTVADRSDLVGIAPGASNLVWVAAHHELLEATEGQVKSLWGEHQDPAFKVDAIAPARDGGCWLMSNGQLRKWKNGGLGPAARVLSNQQAAVSALLEDHDGKVWIGTYGAGAAVVGQSNAAKSVTRDQGLPSNFIRCLFEDDEGNIWAGLEGKGLACIREAVFAAFSPTEGLSAETVLCACEGSESEIWLGTNGDGVQRIQPSRIRHYGLREGLENQFVWTLKRDHTGTLWAGTWGGGLYRLDGDRFIKADAGLGLNPIILAIHEDAQGRLWLGQRMGTDRQITFLDHNRPTNLVVPGTRPQTDVSSLAETADGSLWIASPDEGLFRCKHDRVTRCQVAQGLPSPSCTSLEVDQEGTLWVGLAGGGLVLWENECFKPVEGLKSLLDETINQITDDGLGYLWFGLRNGIVRIKKSDLHRLAADPSTAVPWQRFSTSDGLPGNECTGTGFRARDGRVWFITNRGLAVVAPRQLPPLASPPDTLIEEAYLNGIRIFPPRLASRGGPRANPGLAAPTRTQPVLTIPPGSGQLEIVYTAPSFTSPERLRFRYELQGLGSAPVEANDVRAARYSYLPPGDYEFQVGARYEGGPLNPASASLAFQVLPHYWQTRWFQSSALALLLVVSVATARIVVTRRLHRRMVALEQQRALEVERSRIAQDLHDDLGTSLTEISLLSTLAGSPSSSAAEIKDCLHAISDKSLELVKALDEIVWAVNPKNDSLPNLVNYLCLFTQEFLRPAQIQCRLDVSPNLPAVALNAEQRHTLYLITKEALANAAKHAAATELWLRIALKDSLLTLAIEDNGRGFDPAVARPGGNGLKNIEARMRHLGGRASVHSAPGKGARVELELPLR